MPKLNSAKLIKALHYRGSSQRVMFFFAALTLSGCAQFGPKAIEASRTDYNIAMHRTEEEQSLLNLVRLRYGDRPYFLEATALNTQFSIAPSLEARSTLNSDAADIYNIGGRLAFEEKPTISYAPLTGEAFVRQVLSRISLETILLLDASGWRTERVLRLCVEKLNNLDNAARASGPTPANGADTSKFTRAISIISVFLENGDLRFYRKDSGENQNFVAVFSAEAKSSPNYNELMSLLELDSTLGEYTLAANAVNADGATISFSTRSFMGVLYFLSLAVDVPQEHLAAGTAVTTKTPTGSPFDWSEVTKGLLKINAGDKEQHNANVGVQYRGTWFYIEDTDTESKSTFALLGQLYALQSKNDGNNAPVLTLPLGN